LVNREIAFILVEESEHSEFYIYVKQLIQRLSFDQQELISDYMSYIFSAKTHSHLRGHISDISPSTIESYIGLMEMSAMFNPILTTKLLDLFTHKLLAAQQAIIDAFLEDEIEDDVEEEDEENGLEHEDLEHNEEMLEAEEEAIDDVTESEAFNARRIIDIYIPMIQVFKDETLRRLKQQAGM